MQVITRQFLGRLAAREETDGALVRQFVEVRSESAFAELVRRHGPRVFGVCVRALGDHHLAEDAFQASFVVLARKAHTIHPPEAVGAWLFGVARRAAAEAVTMRRKCREQSSGVLPDRAEPGAEPDDTAAVVSAEIAALPSALRAVVVLCEIEGVSRARAAARLGIAEGTLSSRLARARKQLADRLRSRSVVPAVVGTVALSASFARAAAARADGRATGTVLILSNRVLQTMYLSHRYLTPIAVLLLAAIGAVLASARAPDTAPRGPGSSPGAFVRAPAPKQEWARRQFTLEHTSAVAAVAFGSKTIATFETDSPEPRPRLWSPTDGKKLEQAVRGAFFPKSHEVTLRFTKDDEHLLMVARTEDYSGSATRYRSAEALVGDTMGGFNTIACSADLGILLNRPMPVPGRPLRKDRLYIHGNPWDDQKNFLNHQALFEYPDGKAVLQADLSADGRVLAAAGEDEMIRVYDRATLRESHVIKSKKGVTLNAVRLSDDGKRLAAVGTDGFAKLFDGAGRELGELKGHDGPVVAVAFSQDGKRVATACGQIVRVYETTAGKLLGVIEGHTDTVRAVAFSPDGRRLITGSSDKTAQVWQLRD
jgi:RNA polymerase sigma factor (sigma-70 family)